MLTPKREKFVQNLIAGMSQREAYRNAYNASRMKEATIDRRASELAQNGEIRARLEELQSEFAKRALYTREQAVEDLRWVQQNAREDIEVNGINKANAPAFLNATKSLFSIFTKVKKGSIIKKRVGGGKNEKDISERYNKRAI